MKMFAVTLLILCLAALFVASYGDAAGQPVNTGIQCQCGGFDRKEVDLKEKPLMVQNPLNTTCDGVGEVLCMTICLDLAKMSEGKGPEILCAHLQHAVDLQPSMFIRVCDRDWIYSGITLERPFCCHNGEVVEC